MIAKKSHDVEQMDKAYYRGASVLKGPMIPSESSTETLLKHDSNFQANDESCLRCGDPWRVLRIQAEFVDGFDALSKLGSAVSDLVLLVLRKMSRNIMLHVLWAKKL